MRAMSDAFHTLEKIHDLTRETLLSLAQDSVGRWSALRSRYARQGGAYSVFTLHGPRFL